MKHLLFFFLPLMAYSTPDSTKCVPMEFNQTISQYQGFSSVDMDIRGDVSIDGMNVVVRVYGDNTNVLREDVFQITSIESFFDSYGSCVLHCTDFQGKYAKVGMWIGIHGDKLGITVKRPYYKEIVMYYFPQEDSTRLCYEPESGRILQSFR